MRIRCTVEVYARKYQRAFARTAYLVRIDNPVCVQKGISGWSHAIPQSRTSRFVAKTPSQWSRDRETLRETYTLKDPDPRVFTK